MNKDRHATMTGAAAAIVTGGLAFAAAKHLSQNARFKRKATAKAFKVIGSIMDMI